MTMNTSHIEYFVNLKHTLEASPRGERSALVGNAASFLGCSTATIYRRLEKVGWRSERKVRSDCGKICVDENIAIKAAGMIKQAIRANGKQTLPLTTARDILEKNGLGVLDDGKGGKIMPSTSTIARAMRRHGCHPEQVKHGSPHQSLRSKHPNHVHLMDASVCVVFYLPRGKVRIMEEKIYNENKPKNLEKIKKERVIRWVMTDHRSSMIFARYTLGSEDSENAINTMIEAWCKRDTASGDIFHGVPEILYTDKGSSFTSAMTRSFLARLRVTAIDHSAGNARATGQAENAHNIVEKQFEGRLRMTDIQSLEDLNAHLDDWRIAYNASAIHRRHGKTRNAAWMEITPDQLRIPESAEALRAIVASPPIEKTVQKDMILRYTPKGYGPQTYSLFGIENIMVKSRFGVALNPFEAPAVDVIVKSPEGEERIYTLQPIQRDKAGFDITAPIIGEEFKSPKDTATDMAIKRMDKEAFGVETLEEVEKARRKRSRVYVEIDPMADVHAVRVPDYMPRRGSGVALDGPERELPPLNHVDAAIRIKGVLAAAGIAWTVEHMASLQEMYPEAVPADAIDELAESFIAAETMEETFEQPFRLVAGGTT